MSARQTTPSRANPAFAVLALTLAAAELSSSACARRQPELETGMLRGSNVLLVTIDTLRADRVGSDRQPPVTPALDHLAAAGITFGYAYAHATMTLPSHASILTGLTPPAHGVRNNGSYSLDPSHATLAEILKGSGYRTGAFVGAFVLDARFGLNQGFDLYDDYYGEGTGRLDFGFVERRAAAVLAPAAEWVVDGRTNGAESSAKTRAGSASPWFAWVHLFDPHAPYDAPERRVADAYDNEVAYTDAQLGRFFDTLRRSGQLERTLIVVTADHGESRGDHGEETHGLFAYDATLRVPFIIAGPSVPHQRFDARVGHIDLVPTLLDLLGIPIPAAIQGRSLRAALSGAGGSEAPIYLEALDANLTRNWAPLTGVIAEGWKYIDLPIPELYNLDADPNEQANRASLEPERVRAMATRLAGLRGAVDRARYSRTRADPSVAARLRSLGYIGSQAPPLRERHGYTASDDPKNLLALHKQYLNAVELAARGNLKEGSELVLDAITQRPDFAAAYASGAAILMQLGRPAEAVTLLERAVASGAGTYEVVERLAAALLAAGRPDGVIALLQPRLKDMSTDARNTLAIAYAQRGRVDDARRTFQEVLKEDPSAAGTWNNLALLELETGRRAEAAAAFRRAVDADPAFGAAWQGLGAALLATDREAAIQAWIRAVELVPDAFDTLFNVGMLLAESSRPTDALPYLRRFTARAPPARYGKDIVRVKKLIAQLEGR